LPWPKTGIVTRSSRSTSSRATGRCQRRRRGAEREPCHPVIGAPRGPGRRWLGRGPRRDGAPRLTQSWAPAHHVLGSKPLSDPRWAVDNPGRVTSAQRRPGCEPRRNLVWDATSQWELVSAQSPWVRWRLHLLGGMESMPGRHQLTYPAEVRERQSGWPSRHTPNVASGSVWSPTSPANSGSASSRFRTG